MAAGPAVTIPTRTCPRSSLRAPRSPPARPRRRECVTRERQDRGPRLGRRDRPAAAVQQLLPELALEPPHAIIAFPSGKLTVGRDAILTLYEQMLADKPHFEYEEPLTTLVAGDIALTATEAQDEAGARAQVVRRQGDGSWLRVLDRPDFTTSRS